MNSFLFNISLTSPHSEEREIPVTCTVVFQYSSCWNVSFLFIRFLLLNYNTINIQLTMFKCHACRGNKVRVVSLRYKLTKFCL